MIEIYEKWAQPEAGGAMDTAWNAVVSALKGRWGEQRATLTDANGETFPVVFHGVGYMATAYFRLPAAGAYTLAGIPARKYGLIHDVDAGTETVFEADGALPISISITGAKNALFKVEILF